MTCYSPQPSLCAVLSEPHPCLCVTFPLTHNYLSLLSLPMPAPAPFPYMPYLPWLPFLPCLPCFYSGYSFPLLTPMEEGGRAGREGGRMRALRPAPCLYLWDLPAPWNLPFPSCLQDNCGLLVPSQFLLHHYCWHCSYFPLLGCSSPCITTYSCMFFPLIPLSVFVCLVVMPPYPTATCYSPVCLLPPPSSTTLLIPLLFHAVVHCRFPGLPRPDLLHYHLPPFYIVPALPLYLPYIPSYIPTLLVGQFIGSSPVLCACICLVNMPPYLHPIPLFSLFGFGTLHSLL